MPFNLRTFLNLDHGQRAKTVIVGAVVSISLANLCYLRVWDLLFHNPERNYLTSTPYGNSDFVAALLGVSLLALILYTLITIGWHHDNRWFRGIAMLVVLILFLFPLDFVRRSSGIAFEAFSRNTRWAMIGGTAVVLFTLAMIFRQRFFAVTFWLLALISPYAVFNISHALFAIAFPQDMYPPRILPESRTVVSTNSYHSKQRLVWIIFDEWDQTILFDRRPVGLKLPVLDALVKESVVATHAYAPAGITRVSVPALLSGRLISAAVGTLDSRLSVRFSDGDAWKNFREQETIITDALQSNWPTAIFGWYHPYDRILPRHPLLTSRSFGFPAFDAIQGDGVLGNLIAQSAYLTVPIYGRVVSRDLYLQIHRAALSAVSNPSFKFIFLHYGIPHGPSIYDAKNNNFSYALSGETVGYINNLALVDRTLGELLAALEKADLRASTSLILTSDHWWRSAPWVTKSQGYRVPLIIQTKVGGKAAQVGAQILTTSLRRLADAILSGEVQDNNAVTERLTAEAVEGKVRYVGGIAQAPNSRTQPPKGR